MQHLLTVPSGNAVKPLSAAIDAALYEEVGNVITLEGELSGFRSEQSPVLVQELLDPRIFIIYEVRSRDMEVHIVKVLDVDGIE